MKKNLFLLGIFPANFPLLITKALLDTNKDESIASRVFHEYQQFSGVPKEGPTAVASKVGRNWDHGLTGSGP